MIKAFRTKNVIANVYNIEKFNKKNFKEAYKEFMACVERHKKRSNQNERTNSIRITTTIYINEWGMLSS